MSKRKPTTPNNPSPSPTIEITAPRALSSWIWIAVAAIFVGIICAARVRLLNVPFERDEGSYAYMGQLLLEGKTPYSYFYEMKLPGLFYNYAAVVAIFGKTLEGVHLGFLFITLISTILMYLIGQSLFDAKSGAVAAIAFSILSLTKFASGFTAQAEHLVVFWALLGTYMILRAIISDTWYQYLLAGFFLGMSALVKQSGALFALAAGLFMVFNYVKPLNIKAIIFNGITLVGGFAIAMALFLGLVAAKGSWNEMLFWVLEYPKIYLTALPFSTPDPNDYDGMRLLSSSLDGISRDYLPMWYMAGLGTILLWFTSADLYKKVGVSSFLVLAFMTTTPGLRFYGHYFIQFMPALALAIAAAVYSIDDLAFAKMNNRWAGTIAVIFFGLLSLLAISKQSNYYFSANPNQISRQVYGDNPFVESKVVADKIKSIAKPGDQLLVLGSEPQINFYAQLHTPTRHSFMGFTSSNDEFAKQWREEVKQDTEAAKPTFIVWINHPFSWSFPPDSDQDLFKWGYKYMTDNYNLVGFADNFNSPSPTYVWDQAAMTYQPKGNRYLVVFKRK